MGEKESSIEIESNATFLFDVGLFFKKTVFVFLNPKIENTGTSN